MQTIFSEVDWRLNEPDLASSFSMSTSDRLSAAMFTHCWLALANC